MKILVIGDIVSIYGCNFLQQKLRSIKKNNNIDLVIANGENSAVGNGILPASANQIFDAGVDIITTGNHVFKRREIYSFLDHNDFIIRPANYPESCPGKGYCTYVYKNTPVTVINILGIIFMEALESPFKTIDRLLKNISSKIIIVDVHAEATSEKLALAHYLNGRVSLVYGTHTHVQTADEQILSKSTAYISDIGMVGAKNSILGVCPKSIIEKMTTNMPTRFSILKDDYMINAIIVEIEDKTGKALSIKRLNFS